MPQLRCSSASICDLKRLREFLRPNNAAAAGHAAQAILKALQVLRLQPGMAVPSRACPTNSGSG
jgi:plasmid stabilization system protein ParE